MKLYVPCPDCNVVCKGAGELGRKAKFYCTECESFFYLEGYDEHSTAEKLCLEMKIRDFLQEVKEDQDSANPVYKMCLRCGESMEWPICRNALSRRERVYICSSCGANEAILDMAKRPHLPLSEWAIAAIFEEADQ